MQWVCDICGYVHDDDEAPDICPVCGAPKNKFSEYFDDNDEMLNNASDGEDDDEYYGEFDE